MPLSDRTSEKTLFTFHAFSVSISALVIRVDKVQNEFLFPNHSTCELFQLMSKFAEQQYLESTEFKDVFQRVQAHTGERLIDCLCPGE